VAECLERGDRTTAAAHLGEYVGRHPEQLMFRAQLAELFLTLGDDRTAKLHFERFLEQARVATGPARSHQVHVHTRLMEVGQRAGDRFAELYHRGLGLLLLVKEEDGKPDRDAAFCEEMLCQSLKALQEARRMNPAAPRAALALAEVYERTGNTRAARAEQAAARGTFVPSGQPLRLSRD
jgi:thioredoxin-like negative regulator of GroEL